MGVNFTNKEIKNNRLGNVTFMDTKVTEYLFNDKLVWKYVAPEFTMKASDTSVSEGGKVIVTVTATNVYGGEKYPYTITGITDGDLVEGSVKGFFEMSGAGTGKITIGVKENTVVGDDRTMVITLDETPHIYTSVEVIDETIPPIEGPIGMFYGGSAGGTIVRLDSNGVIKDKVTTGGGGSNFLAGAGLSGVALYYQGPVVGNSNMESIAINREGVVVFTNNHVDHARENLAGARLHRDGLFIGGWNGTSAVNHTTTVDSNGTTVGKGSFVYDGRYAFDGVTIPNRSLFYGGYFSSGVPTYNRLIMGAHNISTELKTVAGTARASLAGSGDGISSIFYGGLDGELAIVNTITKLSKDGDLVGEESNIGTALVNHAGTRIADVNVFFGGENAELHGTDLVRLINDNGAMIGIEKNVGVTSFRQHAGASI